MKIGDQYKITSDDMNVNLYRKGKPRKSGNETWTAIAHVSSPKDALHFMVLHEIRGTGMEDFKTVCTKIDELFRLIDALKWPPGFTKSPTEGGNS